MANTATETSTTEATAPATGNGYRPRPRPEYAGSLEIWKPPTDDLYGQFDLRIEDPEGIQPYNIIKSKHPVRVVCDIWMYGDIWKCVCGYFHCEVCFRPLKEGAPITYDLRERFVGCRHVEHGKVHLEMVRDLPGDRFVTDSGKPTVWEVTASLSFENECGERGTISGFDIAHVQVYPHQPHH